MGNNGQSSSNTRSGGGGAGGGGRVAPPPPQPTVDARGFSDTDTADYHELYAGRQYYARQNLTAAERAALDKYMDPNPMPGSLYNYSQDMNYAMQHGRMNASQQRTFSAIEGAMHNVGYNITLTRYDHGDALDEMLSQAGVSGGHSGMSVAQIKTALVGRSYTDDRILSTSYNGFRKSRDPSTFTTREVKITYRVKASAQGMMPGISKTPMRGSGMKRGDDFGEFLLAPSRNGKNNYKIVDVKLSGSRARRKGWSKYALTLSQIELVVEVE